VVNILTFDIEDWFHINDSTWIPSDKWLELDSRVVANTKLILKMLREHKVRATFFVMGWIAEHYPELVQDIDEAGHEIGYHSYYHLRPMHQSPVEFEKDLIDGTTIIERLINKKVKIYRAPNLSLDQSTQWILPILIRNGIEISSSIRGLRTLNKVKIPNSPIRFRATTGSITEFPLNRVPLMGFPLTFSGGGYFRLFPLLMVDYLMSLQSYNLGYFHPNDFDLKIPKPRQLGIIRNWMNTVGTNTTQSKLNKLLLNYEFVCLGDALRMIENNKEYQNLRIIDIEI
jgi:polysaccharide deacetylase family protein (PEP-CTERM system associated)